MKEKMDAPTLKDKVLVCYTDVKPEARTNAVFLLGCYLIVEQKWTPEEAWRPFASFNTSPFLPYRDATFVRSTFDLPIIECWRGLVKGLEKKLIDFSNFNPDEYDYYDHPQHGDMHVLVPGKFIAFKGPTGRRQRLTQGLFSHTPRDYVEVFRHHGVTAIVRLNSKEYDRNEFLRCGFNHHDLFFEDCTTPSDAIVNKFMDVSAKEKGVLAVHCLAGLGRTGTLIALWMMREYGFTAMEVIGYLRIIRPGSIIGPQQQYLRSVYTRSLKQGPVSPLAAAAPVDSEKLAREVKEGMLRRHVTRAPSSEDSPWRSEARQIGGGRSG
eukprot:CAMPEP_0184322088 /NCGR_PEP_ID=MMETSP1049-20130417/122785_1 /TAXON_ID=77928 /ORGANISM="Proteomonas sulcata, Strain CCMP704" /LENGTH=323 /DNA_ID=CAMNT_0026643111 /DNA_START=52 /DNA_END=1023 /DNA_ORIENTATION=-